MRSSAWLLPSSFRPLVGVASNVFTEKDLETAHRTQLSTWQQATAVLCCWQLSINKTV